MTIDNRPEKCRHRLQEDGKSHPKSGCEVLGCSGVFNALCESKIDYELYEVGGKIRDDIMGIESNDIDYSVVINNKDDFETALDAFNSFEKDIKKKGYDVFLSSPDVFTIRSRFPDSKEVADFVIARKESGFIEGTRRPEKVELGTLIDDLSRRDANLNSIARDMNGNLIDPFNGIKDIKDKILRTPISAEVSFNDDPLRIIRFFRFLVTKNLKFSKEVEIGISVFDVKRFSQSVSTERTREEFLKMFKHSTTKSIDAIIYMKSLNENLYDYIFGEDSGLNLKPTMEKW